MSKQEQIELHLKALSLQLHRRKLQLKHQTILWHLKGIYRAIFK